MSRTNLQIQGAEQDGKARLSTREATLTVGRGPGGNTLSQGIERVPQLSQSI